MRRLVQTSIIALTALGLSANVLAGDNHNAVSSKAKSLVNKIAGSGKIKIDQSFNSIANLDGFVVSKKGAKHSPKAILYVDQKGRYLVSGNIISAKGQNVTQKDHQQYISAKKAPKILKQAKDTHYFQEGKKDAPHKAYILVEPNCSACHILYEHIHSYIKQGKLAVRWIPVAFRKQSSMGKAAAILTSDNPGKALAKNEKGFDNQTETGAIKAKQDVSDAVKKKIKSNMQFMMSNDIRVTPVAIYQDQSGKAQMMRGFPGEKALKQKIHSMNSKF